MLKHTHNIYFCSIMFNLSMFYFFVRTTIFVAEELLYTPFIHSFQKKFLAILPAAHYFGCDVAAVFLIVFEAGAGHGRIRELATRQHLQYYVSNIKYEISCILCIKYRILGIEYEYLIWVGDGLSWIREVAFCTCDPKISSQSLIMQLLVENADFFAIGCGVACCCCQRS